MNITEDEISLDMDYWVDSLEKKVPRAKSRDGKRVPTIYRVPDILKRVDPEAYEPVLVSLGPYQRNKPHLQSMNQLKWKYLAYVLEQNRDVTLRKYLDEIKKLETQARDAYSEEVEMTSKSFVEMMLLDGCFVMLTIMGLDSAMEISEGNSFWTLNVVARDIFMLENQLPFIILETLYKCAYPSGDPFLYLTVEFIGQVISSNLQLPSENETFHHIIGLCLSCINPTRNLGIGNDDGNQSSEFGSLRFSERVKALVPKQFSSLLSKENKIYEYVPQWIPSATVFNEAGIHFEIKKRAKSFLDITFHNGKLKIPQLEVNVHTNSLLRNLIAYEQYSWDSKFHVTCYAQLMNYLIDTAADVQLLQQDEIILSSLGDNKAVATLFNKLSMHAVYDLDNFYLPDVLKDLRKHHHNRYNKWRARFNHDYFSNPWAVISLFGALFLFVLAVTQTIYAALSYGRSSK